MAAPDYSSLFTGAGDASNIDPLLLRAIQQHEDQSGNPRAVNPASGATGVMQFMPQTANEYSVDPLDPGSSIYGAGFYMDRLLQNHGGNLGAALSEYGGDSTGKAGYAGKVLATYHQLQAQAAPGDHGPATDTGTTSWDPGQATYAHLNKPPGTSSDLAQSDVPQGRQEHIVSPDDNPPVPAAGAMPPGLHDIMGGGTSEAPAKPAGDLTITAPGMPPGTPGLNEIMAPKAAAAPPALAPGPAPAPVPAPTSPPPPPIYTAPTTPLIGKEQLPQAMPAPTGQTMPAITPENQAALAGLSHGAREAVNPLLEFGSHVGNTLVNWNLLPEAARSDRAGNDAASNAAFNAQYPPGTRLGDIAQGAASGARYGTPFVVGGGLGWATRAGLEAANFPRLASFLTGGGTSPTAPWWNRLASGVTAGSTQGLVTGGPTGAALGAGIGAAVQPLAAGANALYSRLQPEMAAAQRIFQSLVRDGMSPEEAASGVQRLGPLGTFADLENAPNLRQLAEGVANRPGPGQAVAAQNILPRGEGQQARLEQSIKQATGNPQSAFQETQDLLQQRSAAAKPAYENAFNNTPIRMQASAQLAPYIDTPIGQRALQDGIANARLEAVRAGQPFNLEDYGVQQNPDGSMQIIPWRASLRTYDAVKRGYDQLAEGLRDPTSLRMNYSGTVPVPGGGNISANNVIGARNDVTKILRNAYPEYATALDAWGGPSADLDALRLGRGVLTNDAEQTADNVARLSPSQREMYQAGIAQTLRDTVARTPDDANAVRRIFGNSLYRERIAAGFGGEQTPAFQQFRQDMEREQTFAGTERRFFGGPDTARRLAAIGQLEPGGAFDALTPLTHTVVGNWPGALWNIGHQVMTPLLNRVVQPSDRVSLALGNMLFNPNTRAATTNMLTRGGAQPTIRDVLTSPFSRQAIQQLLLPAPAQGEQRQ